MAIEEQLRNPNHHHWQSSFLFVCVACEDGDKKDAHIEAFFDGLSDGKECILSDVSIMLDQICYDWLLQEKNYLVISSQKGVFQ